MKELYFFSQSSDWLKKGPKAQTLASSVTACGGVGLWQGLEKVKGFRKCTIPDTADPADVLTCRCNGA